MSKSQLTTVLVRTLLFFVVAVVLGFISGWQIYAIIAVALTGGAALVQLGGVLWLARAERERPEAAKGPVKPEGFL
ncbi:hypothetical protein SAMN02982929_00631 [Saccharopolyspora kobensis]|uniref:Uncharacterized protein n=1 Tax=Saccharopolyspora kobensis TaxID=146035 RepID=A0A1H5UTX4_9PSEU|nr:hypothetical protein [Saccharopolyspora kobensis]SEF77921.1 hypothetical protein SAMN02982929_00631 [Saccharopolyspora kobensis]SFC69986.1 hypothetical protein SAMN05216506_1011439 [Saccharopolyspora kobensis]